MKKFDPDKVYLARDIKRVDFSRRNFCVLLARKYNVPLTPLRFRHPGRSFTYKTTLIDVELIDNILVHLKKDTSNRASRNIRHILEIRDFLLYDKPFPTLNTAKEDMIANLSRGTFSCMRTGRPSLFRAFCILGKGSPGKGYVALRKEYYRCLDIINDFREKFDGNFTKFLHDNILQDNCYQYCRRMLEGYEFYPVFRKNNYRKAKKIARFLESL